MSLKCKFYSTTAREITLKREKKICKGSRKTVSSPRVWCHVTSLVTRPLSSTPAAVDVPSLEQNKVAALQTKGGGRVSEGGVEGRGDTGHDVELLQPLEFILSSGKWFCGCVCVCSGEVRGTKKEKKERCTCNHPVQTRVRSPVQKCQ